MLFIKCLFTNEYFCFKKKIINNAGTDQFYNIVT